MKLKKDNIMMYFIFRVNIAFLYVPAKNLSYELLCTQLSEKYKNINILYVDSEEPHSGLCFNAKK